MAKGKKDELLYELQALESGRMKVIVRGALGRRHPRFSQRIRMLNPNLATGFLLRSELQQAGITVAGQIRETALPSSRPPILAEHRSAKLKALLGDMNIYSNNFMAEMIFKHLGAGADGATWARAQAACLAAIEGLGVSPGDLRIVNGSGLYRGTHLSARAMVQLLVGMRRNTTFGSDFVQMLAVSGRAGTLHKRLRGWLRGRVRAKTGTLDEVVSLSGFVRTRHRGELAFAIFLNDATPEMTATLRGHIDRLIARWARM
jgi:D-alanyl-D-alanine carboxypeptidase/D-alanyl-D-alanine-endopeptidase (penicillin-binding protein 4)